jgi:hypothetical protein
MYKSGQPHLVPQGNQRSIYVCRRPIRWYPARRRSQINSRPHCKHQISSNLTYSSTSPFNMPLSLKARLTPLVCANKITLGVSYTPFLRAIRASADEEEHKRPSSRDYMRVDHHNELPDISDDENDGPTAPRRTGTRATNLKRTTRSKQEITFLPVADEYIQSSDTSDDEYRWPTLPRRTKTRTTHPKHTTRNDQRPPRLLTERTEDISQLTLPNLQARLMFSY